MVSVIRAEQGWIVISVSNASLGQAKTAQDLSINKYPLIAWQIENEKATPITPLGTLKNSFVASISPTGEIFSSYTKERVFLSADEWLKNIHLELGGRL